MNNEKPVTLSEISKEIRAAISDNNTVLIPLMGNVIDEKIKANNEVLIPIMGNMMDEKIKANNDIIIPLIDKKIKDNNNILIPLIDKKIRDNIKENNEYIFSKFNNQTERILSLFKGVVIVKKDGKFSINF